MHMNQQRVTHISTKLYLYQNQTLRRVHDRWCTCDMVSQWSKTAWGKAWPEVAARSVDVNPKDSMTGRYAFRLKIGVPTHKQFG